ncbi:MAG: methyltransferase domain-containing protein [Flavobacteriia bacterium]|nr:methyltransferase domain-containing protein [Flavobacteriia bacterium]OIP47668.1 MAG: methyltransferase [Flavobacteriaceae bacterium CG2_30_31_66]PIV97359.1 MAG: methyltransferase [Flavobacteriaceae bacterium CG17_big_fil_post_rev_8_21_14_2_50_31_13]PIX14105.1 MAG: methyltransferase [Flavobacteriaceae bacterium CG_4_8_14_3_um_filter_31_8]PIY14716.1 MAG: methyltransferase [Flavobacteriaceae bacterium CG_4_10_14_3_um_filter_31_253]PIZ12066.1 MAG: methyltransferase [Flavobacteriaceae bacterium
MDFFINTKFRTDKEELMDDFSIGGDLLRDTLDKLENINRWLGGNKVTLNGLKSLLKNHPKDKKITIIDIGCGHGDILRDVAKFGRKAQFHLQLIGVDANPEAIKYAQELSIDFPEISFRTEDIFSENFKNQQFDIVLATLFLHHFKEDSLISFLKNTLQNTKIGIVVNDLHRHKLAYYLFMTLSIFIKNNMIIEDGLTSVLRGFKRKDLEKISIQINKSPQISWKWAFRYLWILKK